jgi:hypothetical protein
MLKCNLCDDLLDDVYYEHLNKEIVCEACVEHMMKRCLEFGQDPEQYVLRKFTIRYLKKQD